MCKMYKAFSSFIPLVFYYFINRPFQFSLYAIAKLYYYYYYYCAIRPLPPPSPCTLCPNTLTYRPRPPRIRRIYTAHKYKTVCYYHYCFIKQSIIIYYYYYRYYLCIIKRTFFVSLFVRPVCAMPRSSRGGNLATQSEWRRPIVSEIRLSFSLVAILFFSPCNPHYRYSN